MFSTLQSCFKEVPMFQRKSNRSQKPDKTFLLVRLVQFE